MTHGIATVGGLPHTPKAAELLIQPSSTKQLTVVGELHSALEGAGVRDGQFPVRHLLPQSVVAHWIWREVRPQLRKERFIPREQIRFMTSPSSSEAWTTIYLRRASFVSRGRGIKATIAEGGLGGTFRAVDDPSMHADLHAVEELAPQHYTGRAADVVMDAVRMARTELWHTIRSTPPCRRFYLHLAPPGEVRFPQWLSVCVTLF